MAILNFPNTGLVANVTQYTGDNGTTYTWDGVKWVGRAAGGAAGTNSLQNGSFTVQVDVDGNLVLPVGSIIKDAAGDPVGGSGTSLINETFEVVLETDGSITFPTQTTVNWEDGTLSGPTLRMGNDPTVNEVVITGPAPDNTHSSARRLIIQGQQGYGGENNSKGEGGDVYIWAGSGGDGGSIDPRGDGGDVKLRGGHGGNNGGYIRVESGNAQAENGYGGFLDLNAGHGNNTNGRGGDVNINAGDGNVHGGDVIVTAGYATDGTDGAVRIVTRAGEWTFDSDGSLTLPTNGDIKDRNGNSVTAGATFDATYKYQRGLSLSGQNSPITESGFFGTYSDNNNDDSDLITSTNTIQVSPLDFTGADKRILYNYASDSNISAYVRVTNSVGAQVARLRVTAINQNFLNDNYGQYHIKIARMYSNGTPSKAKILIVKNQPGFDGDDTTQSDWTQWSGINSDTVMLLSVYGQNSDRPLDLSQLWTFSTRIVDTVGIQMSAGAMRSVFYSQINSIIAESFPPGTLYQGFDFFDNSIYFDGGQEGVIVTTGGGNGASFNISRDAHSYWVNRSGVNPGTGYAIGDTFVIKGSRFGQNSIDGDNDATITVTKIDSVGGIVRWTISGTPNATDLIWPTDAVSDGGSDQEDIANKFFTNYTGNNAGRGHDRAAASGETLQAVPYNDGAVSSTEGFFTATGETAGEYVVAYKSSVVGLLVKDSTATLIETDGNSGFDGSSVMLYTDSPNIGTYSMYVNVIEGSGSWTENESYKFTFDFTTPIGNLQIFYNTISTPTNGIRIASGGEGFAFVQIPRERDLGQDPIELSNGGFTDGTIFDNAGIKIAVPNGEWTFNYEYFNANNPYGTGYPYLRNPNGTLDVRPNKVGIVPNADAVIYTSSSQYVSSFKMLIQVEGAPDSAPSDNIEYWETQTAEAIIVAKPFQLNVEPSITVYGVVHTGTDPVATFSVRRNSTSNRIEVTARTASTTRNAYIQMTVTEILTYD